MNKIIRIIKGGIMKKILVFLALVIMFIACNYATESIGLNPDIEITYLNPIGWITYPGDTTPWAVIEEIHFVAENSIDCYLTKMIWEYYDENNTMFFGPSEISLYAKIEGIVEPGCCDTFILYGIPVPLRPVYNHLSADQSARVLLHFVAVSEYDSGLLDTATAWYGIYMSPVR